MATKSHANFAAETVAVASGRGQWASGKRGGATNHATKMSEHTQ